MSQPANVVDLTVDESRLRARDYAVAIAGNTEIVQSTSPEIIDLEDEDYEPPAKRIKAVGSEFSPREPGVGGEQDEAHLAIAGSPLPDLPAACAPRKRHQELSQRQENEDRLSRNSEGVVPPAIAVRLPAPKNIADFSPWTGNHPEDILNETVVKTGYADKPPGANQSDSNSAKPAIWANLNQKNNVGLQTLSYLFTQVLERRQTLGRCTAPLTFKPPPRVTVTDTKREAWLRDLANPDIPLRKQSRTIPHGIRGKLLMDQCVAKDIPLQRALWLAKCVGANELRAFRRKGVSGAAAASGETKWVREWTVHVEQFLESVIGSCGLVQDWRSKMNYAVKLATSFYSEQLLDQDHYLDWVVSSFANATLETVPVWLVLAQVYWSDAVKLIRRGRRLAESILERLHCLAQAKDETHGALKLRLQKLVAILAATNRGCLVMPETWDRYAYILAPSHRQDGTSIRNSVAYDIARRNTPLIAPLRKTASTCRSPSLRLHTLLDGVGLELNRDALVTTLISLVPDSKLLVTALLDWASSLFRTGLARVYITASLIATLRERGYDTDADILKYLGPMDESNNKTQLAGHVYRTVAELVRLGSFSVGRYMSWLITSGSLAGGESATPATMLLPILPTDGLPGHLRSTVHTLRSRIETSETERVTITRLCAAFDSALCQMVEWTQEDSRVLAQSSLAVMTAVSQHVCQQMRDSSKNMQFDLFCMGRDIFDVTGDVAAMGELICMATNTQDTALLATIADTINMHATSFAAIGLFDDVLEQAIEKYRTLRSTQPLDRTLTLALTNLASRVTGKASLLALLQNDLTMCDQQTSLAVCSPASDSIIDMHASSLDSDEDIDAVFTSGNVMEEALMQRVFLRVVQKCGQSAQERHGPESNVCRWLNQLRALDGEIFGQLVASFHRLGFGKPAIDHQFAAAIVALVASGCLGLHTALESAQSVGSQAAAVAGMQCLLRREPGLACLHAVEQYRYRVAQRQCRTQHPSLVTAVLTTAWPNLSDDNGHSCLDEAVLEYSILSAANTGTAATSSLSLTIPGYVLEALLQRILRTTDDTRTMSITAIVEASDSLSVVLCAPVLKYLASQSKSTGEHEPHRAMMEAIETRNPVWPQLIGALDDVAVRPLHAWVQDRLLSSLQSAETHSGSSTLDTISRDLDVLDITQAMLLDEDDTDIVHILTERVKEIGKRSTDGGPAVQAQLQPGLQVLLHVCALHLHPNSLESSQRAHSHLLSELCALLVQTSLQTQSAVSEHIFDLASTLADALPEDMLPATKSRDPRIEAIIGAQPVSVDAWLALATHTQPAPAAMTQQQRALNKHPSAQHALLAGRQNITGPPAAATPQTGHGRGWPHTGPNRPPGDTVVTPFALRRWEVMPDSTPVMGANDTSLSLALFGARKV